jgi:hypothetical protein
MIQIRYALPAAQQNPNLSVAPISVARLCTDDRSRLL